MGISRDSAHKRRLTGGRMKPIRKKRKYEMGRQPAMTKIGERVVRKVRVRGGSHKLRALRLDHGNFTWTGECVARKTRILTVVYNSTSNELVRTNTLVKSCIVQIDATPFKVWYQKWYNVLLQKPKEEKEGDKKAAEKKGGEKKDKKSQPKKDHKNLITTQTITLRQWKAELKARKALKGRVGKPKTDKPAGETKPAAAKNAAPAKGGAKKTAAAPAKGAAKKQEPAKGGAKKQQSAAPAKGAPKKQEPTKKAEPKKAEPAKADATSQKTTKPKAELKPKVPHVEKEADPNSKSYKHKMEVRNKRRVLEAGLADQFKTGRLYARITSRPGQSGRADGIILEGEELAFYIKKISGKRR